MSEKRRTYGFGVDPVESQNHFFVIIPPKGSAESVEIYERFEWTQTGLTQEEQLAKPHCRFILPGRERPWPG